MQITLTAGDLSAALGLMRALVPTRTTISLINNVKIVAKFGGVVLTSTDIVMVASLSEVCEVIEEGETTVPAQTLLGLAKGMPQDKLVTLKTEEGRAKFSCGRSSYNLGTLPTDGFPEAPAPEPDAVSFTMSAAAFRSALIATRDTTLDRVPDRFFMQGICVYSTETDIVFASMNGKQFSDIRLDRPVGLGVIPLNKAPIIPNSAVRAMATILASQDDETIATITLSRRRVWLKSGLIDFTSQLVEGEFMEYEALLPDPSKASFKVSAEVLASALSRLMVIYSGTDVKAPVVVISCVHGGIQLVAGKAIGDNGSEVVEAEIIEKCAPIGVSVQLLSELVALWPKDSELTFCSTSPSAPILIVSDSMPRYRTAVAPMSPGTQIAKRQLEEVA